MRSRFFSSSGVYLMMSLSLVALIAFFAYWLTSSFAQEKEQLRREANFLLMNSARNIEDALLSDGLPRNFERRVVSVFIHRDSSIAQNRVDSLIDFELSNKAKGQAIRAKISIRRMGREKFPGLIGDFIQQGDSSLNSDTIQLKLKVKELLNSSFIEMKLPSDLNNVVKLIFDHELINKSDVRSRIYLDKASNLQAQVVIPSAVQYLIKKIWPRILISILILTLTVFSFYLLHRNLKSIQSLADARSSLMGNITHELNTPITTARLAIEAIKSGELSNEKREEYLFLVENEIDRLALLVGDIVQGLTANASDKESWSAISLNVIVKNVLQDMSLYIEEFNGLVKVNTDSNSAILLGDEKQIMSVLRNLIDNGLKYSQPHPELTISIQMETSHIRLSVQDNGQGIEEKHIPHLFEPFYRVPTGNLHDVKGQGLGLNIVQQIVQHHGGRLTVKSELEKGSTFTIMLPKFHDEDKNSLRRR